MAAPGSKLSRAAYRSGRPANRPRRLRGLRLDPEQRVVMAPLAKTPRAPRRGPPLPCGHNRPRSPADSARWLFSGSEMDGPPSSVC
jgi:hypothetical protein